MLSRQLLQLTPIFSANKGRAHLFVAVAHVHPAFWSDQENSSLRRLMCVHVTES